MGEDPVDTDAAFSAHYHHPTRTPMRNRAPREESMHLWHLRMGHPNPEALQRLTESAVGIRFKGPTTVECDGCGQAKVTRKVSTVFRPRGTRRAERIAMDIHDLHRGYDGSIALFLFTDRFTGYMWDYYISNKSAETLLQCIYHLIALLWRRYDEKIRVFECDTKIPHSNLVSEWLQARGYALEPCAPYTQAQNGGAERSGGMVKDRARAMVGKLPKEVWPEVYKTSVYTWNRIPRYMYEWKSPYEMFFGEKPLLGHTRAYGCKAFALTTDALAKQRRLEWLSPKAWIGFLVRYSWTNLYRIWLPTRNKVIVTRDVHFNERCLFDGELEGLRQGVKAMAPNLLAEVLEKSLHLQTLLQEAQPDPEEEHDLIHINGHVPQGAEDAGHDKDDPKEEEQNQYTTEATAVFRPMLTPPDTPPASLLAAFMRGSVGEKEMSASPNPKQECQPWEYAFHSAQRQNVLHHDNGVPKTRVDVQRSQRRARGSRKGKPVRTGKFLSRDKVNSRLWGNEKIHRRELEPAPDNHWDIANHSMRDAFLQAERDHLVSHDKMRSWSVIRRALVGEDEQVLDCMWVYTYKFNKAGWLQKCKARLVVRGDQQKRVNEADTYAATLAGRSFKALLAIATRFNLEMLQYDAVNAFCSCQVG